MEENASNPKARAGCYCGGAGPHVSAMFESMWSQASRDHFRNARLEFLKGVRTLIDHRIERLSKTPPPRGASVPVD